MSFTLHDAESTHILYSAENQLTHPNGQRGSLWNLAKVKNKLSQLRQAIKSTTVTAYSTITSIGGSVSRILDTSDTHENFQSIVDILSANKILCTIIQNNLVVNIEGWGYFLPLVIEYHRNNKKYIIHFNNGDYIENRVCHTQYELMATIEKYEYDVMTTLGGDTTFKMKNLTQNISRHEARAEGNAQNMVQKSWNVDIGSIPTIRNEADETPTHAVITPDEGPILGAKRVRSVEYRTYAFSGWYDASEIFDDFLEYTQWAIPEFRKYMEGVEWEYTQTPIPDDIRERIRDAFIDTYFHDGTVPKFWQDWAVIWTTSAIHSTPTNTLRWRTEALSIYLIALIQDIENTVAHYWRLNPADIGHTIDTKIKLTKLIDQYIKFRTLFLDETTNGAAYHVPNRGTKWPEDVLDWDKKVKWYSTLTDVLPEQIAVPWQGNANDLDFVKFGIRVIQWIGDIQRREELARTELNTIWDIDLRKKWTSEQAQLANSNLWRMVILEQIRNTANTKA